MADELSQVTEDSARGGFFLFSGSTLAMVILAVSAILIGRFLGPELYGQYNLVLVIPSLLLLFTDLGVNAGITKFAASLRVEGKSEQIPNIIRYGMLFRLAIGLIVMIISVVFASYFALIINRPDYGFYIQIASVSVIFQVIFTTANSAFVGLDKSEYSALSTNVSAAAKTILQIAFVLLGFNVAGALVGHVGGFIVASIVGSILLFFKFLKPSKTKEKGYKQESYGQVLKLLTRYGMPIYVSVVLTGFLPLYQQVILAFFTSDTAIGNFRAAINFVALLAVIPTSITIALLPAFSKLGSSTPEKVTAFFKRANKYTCLLIIPATTLVILFSAQIVQLVYGSLYSSAALYLSASSLVYFFVLIGSLSLTSLFNGLGKTRLTLNVTIINFLILLVLAPVLTQAYGVIGAIVALLIAGAGASSYAAYVAVRQLKVEFAFKSTLRICLISVLSSIPPLGLLFFTSLNYVVILILGTIVYLLVFVTLMPLVGVVNQAELKALGRVTGKISLLKLFAKPLFKYQQKILLLVERPREASEKAQ